jgi:2-polyprenyl-3-methyl-5-hydroxy-6-metoxy-1,4-benzoquinol methylase
MALKWMDRLEVPKTLLDVGCGPGTFLMVAQERGWDVHGIELAREAGAWAQRFGLDVHIGTLDQYAPSHQKRFGVVTSFEVLEHVSDPLGMLRSVREVLAPNGRLILSVPNLDDPYCLKQRIPHAMPPIHINFFNRLSIRRLLEASGFEVIRFYTLPIPTSSVRNTEGKAKATLLIPWLMLKRLVNQADGTTLITMAR